MKSHAYQKKGIAVFGLGKSGLATARRLHDGQANVFVWDDHQNQRAAAAAAGLDVRAFDAVSRADVDMLVLSPGVPLTHPKPHPVVQLAREVNLDVVGDMEIFLKEKTAGRVVGITGTNGKSTTTALINHILKTAGEQVAMGGNIGTPVMDLPQLDENGVYVLELSSYQLDLTPSWHADVAILLNITPDHLDRHSDMDGYTAVKKRIFQNQMSGDVAVVNIDDPICRQIFDDLDETQTSNCVAVSTSQITENGVSVVDAVLHDRSIQGENWTCDLSGVEALRGTHNWQNAAAAYAACRALGIGPEHIVEGLKSFGGLAHRMESIRLLKGVRFVNDSKATNADAAEKSLASYDNIHWICGGVPKAGGIEPLSGYFSKVTHAYLIGEAADAFAESLKDKLPYTICNTLDAAVQAATKASFAEDKPATILLAPAAASFDQFPSFEARGEAFRDLVCEVSI
jgi:UDP-N-acetylmuramoylalanine--D-glutamate ligase